MPTSWPGRGKNAVQGTKLSCRTFKDNQTRLQRFALAYDLGNFLRRLALPQPVRHWSLTTGWNHAPTSYFAGVRRS